MGKYLFDQYTYLHFATGIISYFWGINLKVFIIIHTLFEFIENTEIGLYFINHYLFFWPGGKPYTDSITNILGDTIGSIIGWSSAYYLDVLGKKKGWYNKHLKIKINRH